METLQALKSVQELPAERGDASVSAVAAYALLPLAPCACSVAAYFVDLPAIRQVIPRDARLSILTAVFDVKFKSFLDELAEDGDPFLSAHVV